MEELTFFGNDTYSIDCKGDAVVGDEVAFEQAIFEGSFRSPQFIGYELIKGKILKESYGQEKQQHTFTIELIDGSRKRIKGRNLYRNGIWRKPWGDESLRFEACDEKHHRGDAARSRRNERRELGNQFMC